VLRSEVTRLVGERWKRRIKKRKFEKKNFFSYETVLFCWVILFGFTPFRETPSEPNFDFNWVEAATLSLGMTDESCPANERTPAERRRSGMGSARLGVARRHAIVGCANSICVLVSPLIFGVASKGRKFPRPKKERREHGWKGGNFRPFCHYEDVNRLLCSAVPI